MNIGVSIYRSQHFTEQPDLLKKMPETHVNAAPALTNLLSLGD